MPDDIGPVDHHALFAALPAASVLLDADLVVRAVTPAFLAITGRERDQVIDRPLLESYPRNPTTDGVEAVRAHTLASVQRALSRGTLDRLEPFRYDLELPAGSGQFHERWWMVTNAPLMVPGGSPRLILHTAEDVTARIGDRERRRLHQEREVELMQRTERLESDLQTREQQVLALSASEELVGRRLQGLAFVALELAAADTVEELTDLVVVRGVAAMGCDGGGVAVRDDAERLVRLTITDTRREGQRLRQEMPLDTRLPSVVTCRVPEPIYLGNRDEGYAWGPEMELVYTTSGCDAWASLPLVSEGRMLGSLTVSWVHERTFTDGERELLAAFAAQCAQALQRIQAREVERAAMATSRLLSESLQRSLLTEPVEPEHLHLVVRYLTASREAYVGGDWYDAFRVPDGDLVIVIGDIAGHDRQATAAMAQVRGVLRGVAHSLDGPPSEVLTCLDRALRDLRIDALATSVLARVKSGPQPRMSWSNAGHPPPLLVHPDGTCELLDTEPELLLGVLPGTIRTDHELVLAEGATLLLYTDGLVERRGETLTTGLEWLRQRVASLASLPVDVLCDRLLAELPTDAEDDVALLAVRAAPTGQQTRRLAPVPAPARAARPTHRPARRRPDVSVVLPSQLTAVRRARAFVRNHCLAEGVPESICETVVLLTSETVTNAFIHGRSEARLRLVVRPGRVRVEVGDDNSRHPKRAERQNDALDGRGLDILDLLSASWGVQDDVAGKVVWFEVTE